MQKIIIDTDPGIDDAIAILLALAAKDEVDLLALTTVTGNVGLNYTAPNACKILTLAERTDIPVYRGCAETYENKGEADAGEVHGNDGLGGIGFPDVEKQPEEEHAVDFLIRKARELKGELVLVPIGPLTNIARAVEKDPEFVNNVKEVIMMGGAEFKGNVTPHAEFNFWKDPVAAKIVFEAGFKNVTMVGLDAIAYAKMNATVRELLYQINTPISKFIYDITRVYLNEYWRTEGELACRLCDVLAIAQLLDPSVCELVDAHVAIETQGLCEGASVVYRPQYFPEKEVNCKVAVKTDNKRFIEVMFGRMFPEYKEVAMHYA